MYVGYINRFIIRLCGRTVITILITPTVRTTALVFVRNIPISTGRFESYYTVGWITVIKDIIILVTRGVRVIGHLYV